jgi:hypothetical protein
VAFDFEISARPFRLEIKRTGSPVAGQYPPRRFSSLAMPDTLYRKATRRVVRRLIAENKELRRDYRRRENRITTVVVKALDYALRERQR